MTTVFCYSRVADYEFWRAGYARAVAATEELRTCAIWRGQDRPNSVIKAAKFLRSSSLRPGFLQKYVCPLAIGVCLALFLHPFHYCKHLLNFKNR